MKENSSVFSMFEKLRQCSNDPSLIFKNNGNEHIDSYLRYFLFPKKCLENDENVHVAHFHKNLNHIIINDNIYEEIVQKIRNQNFEECSICLNQIQKPTLSRCTHVFCYSCFMNAIDINQTCPLCRNIVNPKNLLKLKHQ